MQVVAGLSLKGKKPKVWNPDSPYYLPSLRAVMVSYAEFNGHPVRRQHAMKNGLHHYLNVPKETDIYLDNGAFTIMRKGGQISWQEYVEFVREAKPNWYPVPQDFIPVPKMTDAEQLDCLRQTMEVNRAYQDDGFVPVIHISRHLEEYLQQLQAEDLLESKKAIALGGIVPNLLRAPKAMAHTDVLEKVRQTRLQTLDKELHIYGMGGTATLHLAALLDVDSVDSSGWRNRAARGIIQLPGRGERMVANLGNWRGREPNEEEWSDLKECSCPACQQFGTEGLKADRIYGFSNRATHNLWVLLNEVQEIEAHLNDGTYDNWFENHLDNTVYLPLIRKALELRND